VGGGVCLAGGRACLVCGGRPGSGRGGEGVPPCRRPPGAEGAARWQVAARYVAAD